jgi:hypothetical protein
VADPRGAETRIGHDPVGANLVCVVSSAEHERFVATGVLRLDGALTDDDASAMRSAVWRYVEGRTAIRFAEPATWPGAHAINFRGIKRSPALRALLAAGRVRDALDDAFGSAGWQPPKPGAQILLTFPSPGPWVLPHGRWHSDFAIERPSWPASAVKLFAFLTEVEPSGGGTLVLSGSHRLVERFAADLPVGGHGAHLWTRFMKGDPWLHDVHWPGPEPERTQRLLGVEHEVDGVPVSVVELTGRPGDVVLTHQDVLHVAAPNTRSTPRIMLGLGIRRARPADQSG